MLMRNCLRIPTSWHHSTLDIWGATQLKPSNAAMEVIMAGMLCIMSIMEAWTTTGLPIIRLGVWCISKGTTSQFNSSLPRDTQLGTCTRYLFPNHYWLYQKSVKNWHIAARRVGRDVAESRLLAERLNWCSRRKADTGWRRSFIDKRSYTR